MSNIRSRIARLEKANDSSNVYEEAAECVRAAQGLHYRVDTRGQVGNEEKGRGWMDASELRRRLEDDSLTPQQRRVYMQDLEHKTDNEVERQTIQAMFTEMGWEEVKALRRQAGEKGLSKRRREVLLRIADANERVLRMRGHGGQTLH